MATEPTPISPQKLPPITILIEWENATDVEDKWTHRAMQALETDLAASRDLMPAPPRVMYLYDRGRVAEELIRGTIAKVAPRIPELCKLELVPTPGLTYYKLKNYGVARTETEFVVMLDSDAAPQPGWLPGLLAPFADPKVMAVGGFTVLAYDDLLSKVLALIWIFHLRGDRKVTLKRKKINANNCAFRTEFFKANPWPDLPVTRGPEVELRWWQVPAALLVGNLYFAVLFVGQIWGALARSYIPLAEGRPAAADVSPSASRTASR